MSRRRAGPFLVAVAAALLGWSAGQLWAHHVAGWYLFAGGMLLTGVGSLL